MALMPNSHTIGTVLGPPSTTSTPTPYSASTSREHRSPRPQTPLNATTTRNPWNLAMTPPARTAPASSPTTSTRSSQTGTTPSANATVYPSTAATSTPKPTGNSSPRPSRPNPSDPRFWKVWPSGSMRLAPIVPLRISMRRRVMVAFPVRISWRGRSPVGILPS